MANQQRPLKVKCTKCGKRQGNCFAYCVMCGAKLPQGIIEMKFRGEKED